LPAELYKGPKGGDLEGRGLAPDVPLAVFPDSDLAGGHAKAILELMKEIRPGATPVVGTPAR